MKIMICDDDLRDRNALVCSVKSIWPDAEIDNEDNAQAVLRLLQRGRIYDLVFMDIYLDEAENAAEEERQETETEGPGGLTAGRWIQMNFPEISMVYVSNSRDFGPEVFDINALHYLIKPLSGKNLEEVKRRYEERKKERMSLRVSTRVNGSAEIPFQRIAYIESEHNNLQIHLLNGSVFIVRDSVQNYMKKLDERFLRVNRGVVVNMEAVDKMNTDSCEIAGKVFMLSRKTKKDSRQRYHNYLFETAMRAM